MLFNLQKDYDSIMFYLDEIEHYSLSLNDTSNFVLSLIARTSLTYETENFEDNACFAKRSFNEGLQLLSSDPVYTSAIYNNLSLYYEYIGDYLGAKKLLENSRSQIKKGDSIPETFEAEITILQNLGHIISSLGDFSQAISYYQQSIKISQDSLDSSPFFSEKIRDAYYSIGKLLYFKKDYNKSISYFKNNIELIRGIDNLDLAGLIQTHISLANSYRASKKPSEGLESLKIASHYQETYIAKNKNRLREENFYNVRAKCYTDTGKLQKAYHDIEKALLITRRNYRSFKKNILEGNLLITHGDIFAKEEKYKQALEKYQEALYHFVLTEIDSSIYYCPSRKDFENIENSVFEILKKKNSLLLKLYKSEGDWEALNAAWENSLLLVQLADRFRQQIQTQGSQLFISTELKPAYEKAIEIALELFELTKEQSYLNEAFKISEKSKAAILSSALASTNAKYTGGVPDSVLSQERELLANISFYKKQVFEEENKVSGSKEARINQWERKIFELEQQKDDFDKELEKSYPLYFQYKYQSEEILVSEIRSKLKSSTHLIEYFAGDSTLYVFNINKTGISYRKIDKPTLLYDKISKFTTRLADINKQAQDISGFSQESHFLCEKLLGKSRGKADKFIIIPDGILGRLPFELLISESSEKQNFTQLPYLLIDHDIQYGYSALLLFKDPLKRSYKQAKKMWAGFAPSFEGAKQLLFNQGEVEEINTQMKGLAYTGQSANLKTFLNQAENYRIIHLATHAYADLENPQFSKLEFTYQDSLNDGVLYAHELANQKLNAELVVLSACETGHGSMAQGEGIMSLAWSFRYAGVPSILMSLWKAESNVSKQLMLNFYKHLNKGESKAKALQLAKRDYLMNPIPGKEHPRNWANFVVIGDDTPISQDFSFWWAIGFIILLPAFVYGLYHSQRKN